MFMTLQTPPWNLANTFEKVTLRHWRLPFVKWNLNPLKPKLTYIILRNSVHTAKKTTHLHYKDE
jgi:hypothetical protein